MREQRLFPANHAKETPLVRVEHAIADLVLLLERLPPDRLGAATGLAWGPRQVLAHLVYWHEHYVRYLHARLAGEEPPLPCGTLKAMNAQAVSDLSAEPLPRLIERLSRAQAQLRRLYGVAEAYGLTVRLKKGGKAWPVQTLIARVAGHIQSHQRQLQLGSPTTSNRLRAATSGSQLPGDAVV